MADETKPEPNIYVLVTGGRKFDDRQSMTDVLGFLKEFYGDELRVIHGGAPGADLLAKHVCAELGIPCREYPADWKRSDPADLYARMVNVRGEDLSGQIFDDLVVDQRSTDVDPKGSILWELTCTVCGDLNTRTTTDLRRGRTGCRGRCRDEKAEDSPVLCLFRQYQRNARLANREFSLTFEWFNEAIRQPCHYCYSPPSQVYKKPGARRGVTYNGLDRVDSARGYVPDNVVPCCKYCNFAKGRWGVTDFNDWLVRVRTGYGKKAGFIRNTKMVNLLVDWRDNHGCRVQVMSFPGENGTKHCSGEAERAGIIVDYIRPVR